MTILCVAAAFGVQGCQPEADTSAAQATLNGTNVGMVIDNVTGSATVFDADTNTVLGTVPGLGVPLASGDCSITPDGKKGFFTQFDSTITAVDLTTTPPSHAGGANPIPISNPGEDTAISGDGKFLVVCDGSAIVPVSVVDVATQTEISTFNNGIGCNAVDVCSDGSVLIVSFFSGVVQRLTLSETGTLSDTGEVLFAGTPMNVYCSPAATAGVVLDFFGATATSFRIPGLAPVSTVFLGDFAVSGAFNRAGDRAFFRTDFGLLSGFTFDETTALLGAPLFETFVAPLNSFFGMDQFAVHPSDASLYVSEPGFVTILDATTGANIGTIFGDSLFGATGVCFPTVSANQPPVALCADRTVPADATCQGDASVDNGSFDPDGDPIECVQQPSGPYGEGTTTVTLTCTDPSGESSSCTATVTVVDETPPVVVTTNPDPLWPPNHKYRRIDLDDCIVAIRDTCDGTLDIASHATVTCCTSDEPDNGLGDGDTANDCVIVDGDSVDVRAERAGNGNGRVYTIHYTVTDDSNNSVDETCTVSVPHSRNGSPAVDDGAQTTCGGD